MANELQFYGTPATDSGLTIVARVYDNAGVQTGGDVSCTEVGVLAIYRGDMPSASAGEYVVRFFSGSDLVAQGLIYWDGSAEITIGTVDTVVDGLNDVSSADVLAQVSAGLATYDAPTKAELDSGLAGLNDPTAAAVAAQVRTELTTELSEVTAVKAKTDSLTFTVTGKVDANNHYINDIEVVGTGTSDDPWGPG